MSDLRKEMGFVNTKDQVSAELVLADRLSDALEADTSKAVKVSVFAASFLLDLRATEELKDQLVAALAAAK